MGKLNSMMQNIEIAMLTTKCSNGELHSRPMQTQNSEFDGKSLFFFTTLNAPKCQEIKTDDHVNVCFSEPSKNTYVSLLGRGEILTDKSLMKKLWTPTLKAWFPKELDDPNIALLKINVVGAEYWDSSKTSMVKLFGMAKSYLSGEPYTPSLDENKKIDMSSDKRPVTA